MCLFNLFQVKILNPVSCFAEKKTLSQNDMIDVLCIYNKYTIIHKQYTNIQDRMKQKMKDGAGAANIQIARGILNVLDNYDRAFASVNAETDEQKAVEATYKETYDMILAKFEELGVHAVDTVGKEFDYEFHSAVMMRPDEDYEEGIVCEELAKGFAMEDGTLIRAAMVVVAA
jgi:molecular chaperone GrpE